MDDKKLDEATLSAVMKYCSDKHDEYVKKYEESGEIYYATFASDYFDVWDWCYKQTESYRLYEQSRKGENNGE